MKIKNIKYILSLLTVLVVFNACKKEYESIESIDEVKIQAYIKQNNIQATKDPSGYYYQILEQGTGGPLLNKDSIFYDASVKSLSGASYYTTPAYWNEGNYLGYVTPQSYRTALYAVNRGGKVKVIVPSYLAYGKNGSGSIPSNEVLVTEITVYPETTQWEIDDKRINKFMLDKGLTDFIKQSSRVYYKVSQVGTETEINQFSTITVKYTGRVLSGSIFDQTTGDATRDLNLNEMIAGWKKVLVGMKKGTKVRMLIPSDLAYGASGSKDRLGNVIIPSNTILDFDIEVVDVKN